MTWTPTLVLVSSYGLYNQNGVTESARGVASPPKHEYSTCGDGSYNFDCLIYRS